MKRKFPKPFPEAWKFYIHDNGSWAWKHRDNMNVLVGHADGFKDLADAMNDARTHGFTEDQHHKIRDC